MVDSGVYLGNCNNSTLVKALHIKLLEWGGKDRISLWQRSADYIPLVCKGFLSWPLLERVAVAQGYVRIGHVRRELP